MTWRKIHFNNGVVWKYRIGIGYVVLESPTGSREIVDDSTLTGRTPDTIERGKWKKTPDGMILPSHVKAWIMKNRFREGGPASRASEVDTA